MKNSRIFICILFSWIFFAVGFAKEYSPEDITNPNIKDRRVYVADPANLVGASAKTEANNILWNLRRATGVEAVIVVVPNTGDYTREEFAVKLFDLWKIGKSDKDNGILVLIIPDQREAWLATGYGVEGVIPDISAAKIIDRSVVANMKRGDLDSAVVAVAKDVAKVVSDPEAAEELKSSRRESWEELPESDITAEDIVTFAIGIVLFIAMASYIIYFYHRTRIRRKDRYNRARSWHDNLEYYKWMAILSAGLGLLPYMLAKRQYRKTRNSPMVCPACKGKMHKLNEEEDNNLLSPSQDFEEKINSVDYDVWVCDRCGSVERYAFPNNKSPYEECPHCHTKAMTMIKDHTVIPATTRASGVGEKIYDCKYCRNQTKRRYTIPKRNDGTGAALAAGAVLGSGRGGGFGGGFGGGSTGGGGGGGRW